MKAQSLRRVLWLSNALLGLAAVGAGGWYVLKVRPAAASAKKEPWVDQSTAAYTHAKQVLIGINLWPVTKEDLETHILHKGDWMSKEVGVWAYVGPVPPPPRVIAPPTEKPPEPTGLEAIGGPSYVWIQPAPDRSVVKWTFPSKKAGFFVPGEFIKEGKDAKGRFKFVAIERVECLDTKYKIAYEVYDDPEKAPVSTGASEFTLFKDQPTALLKPPPAAAGTGAPKPPLAEGVAPPRADVKIVVVETSESSRKVEFDDLAYRYVRFSNADALMAEVQTEEAKDPQGQPNGIRVTGIGPASLANDFGIKQGDILKAINGTPVHSRAQAIDVVKTLPKEIANVRVVVERNGRDITFDVDPRDPKVRAAAGRVGFKK